MNLSQNSATANAAVDHLLLGAADLDVGVAWAASLTGVNAASGGSHPGAGTRNALLSLGGRQYLEIIAPDPAQTAFHFHIDIRTLTAPRLIAWAAATADIHLVAKRARDAGFEVLGPRDGSRVRPDGKQLRWQTLAVANGFGRQGVEAVPFFIQWAAGSVHPSQDSPGGCELLRLEIEHPDSGALTEALQKLGIEAAVKQATAVRLRATLKTPQGEVELS